MNVPFISASVPFCYHHSSPVTSNTTCSIAMMTGVRNGAANCVPLNTAVTNGLFSIHAYSIDTAGIISIARLCSSRRSHCLNNRICRPSKPLPDGITFSKAWSLEGMGSKDLMYWNTSNEALCPKITMGEPR